MAASTMPPPACIVGAATCEGGPQPSLRYRWNRSSLFQSGSGGSRGRRVYAVHSQIPRQGRQRRSVCHTLYGRSERDFPGAARWWRAKASQGPGGSGKRLALSEADQPSAARQIGPDRASPGRERSERAAVLDRHHHREPSKRSVALAPGGMP